MSRSLQASRKLSIKGIWLPCGMQNYFNPAAREDRPKAMLKTEMNLVEHLRDAKIDVPDPKPSGWRNLYYSWARWGDQYIYTDSDGFIIAAGENPEFPQLVTSGYWVPRSRHADEPDAKTVQRADGMPGHSAPGQDHSNGDQSLTFHAMLTNFQMNILFEGIWNSAADPRVFLLANKKEAQNVERAFTFDRLIDELMVSSDEISADLSEPFPISVRRLIFLQAVRVMRNEHLLPLKWNIEASRRHLFSETMTMLHRPESLRQYMAKAPSRHEPDQEGRENFTTRDALFTRSSDEQLRGYVMLISAKLPLIDNLTFLIGDCWEGLALDSELQPESESGLESDGQGIPRVIHDVVETWKGTANALHKNVEALERSFANIWQDKLLHETEQVRVEEEALGELQRQQARDKSDRWFDTLVFVVTLAVAGAALFFSINGADSIKNHKTTVFVIAGLIVVALTVVFWVVPKVVAHFASEYIPRFELVARLDEPLVLQDSGRESGAQVSKDGRRTESAWTGSAPDWMNMPFLGRAHAAIEDDPRARALAPRWPRLLTTRKMRGWIGLPCFTVGSDPEKADKPYPVGVYLADEAPRIRVDSPGEIDTYSRIHLDVKILLPCRRSLWARFSHHEYRSVVRNITGWYHRLTGSYLVTFPRRCVTVQCAIELHKHSPDPGAAVLYFIREARLIMSSRAELRPEETLMCTLIADFLLVKPWVQPYADLDERRTSVRVSLLTDRLETHGWLGSVLSEGGAPRPEDGAPRSALVEPGERHLLQQQPDGGGDRDRHQHPDDAEQHPADQHRD